jgi:hypothetical protein
MRRPNPWHAARFAEKRGVELALLLRRVLHLGLQLRFVRRLIRVRVRLLRITPVAPLDERIALAELAVDRRVGSTANRPEAVEIRVTIGELRRRLLRGIVGSSRWRCGPLLRGGRKSSQHDEHGKRGDGFHAQMVDQPALFQRSDFGPGQ